MPDPSRWTAAQLAHQVRSHLDSLRSAGLDWLPFAPPPEFSIVQSTTETPAQDRPTSTPNRVTEEPACPEIAEATEPSITSRRQALQVLAGQVSACARCPGLAATRTQTVFGVGQVGADLCFVGEAPGADEDRQGEPFVGAAGQLLDRIIAACGMKRDEVYICNIIKCRPPGNRVPTVDEAGHCREWLEKQIELVHPKFICALGGTAANNLLGTTKPIGQLRQRFHDFKGIPVLCTYHPAFLLPHRSPHKKRDVWDDMKMLLAKMGRTIPKVPSNG